MGCPCLAFHFIMDDASLERAMLLRRIGRQYGSRNVSYVDFDEYHAIVVEIPHCRLRVFLDDLQAEGLVLHGIDVSTSEQVSIVETRGQKAHLNAWPVNPKWIGDKYPAGSPPRFAERRKAKQWEKKEVP